MTALLDGNVLVALVVEDHVHHARARTWFDRGDAFATCPITQGTLVRILVRGGVNGGEAAAVLRDLIGHTRHEFWPDNLGYDDVDLAGVIGHRQVTDAYLASLARSRSARVVTFDRALSECYPDVAELAGDR